MFAGRVLSLFLLAFLLALGVVRPAFADLMLGLRLSEQGYATYTVTGSADPLISTQNFGTFTTNIQVNNVSTDPLSIDLGSLNLSSLAPGNLTIEASVTGLDSPLGATAFLSQLSGNGFGSLGSVSLNTYLSNSDTMFGTDTLLTSLNATASLFAESQSAATTTTGPYAITEVLTINTTGVAGASVDASTTAAPEIDARAGGVAIAFLVGLVALLAERRRRPAASA
ncbi:MAG TPA: hypothetical protein VGG57_18760 [Stellaceae bacterium]|jgi:hypothetical protein